MPSAIPTREEHDQDIRKLWKFCITLACVIFAVTGTSTGIMFLIGMDPKNIVAVSTAIFQVLILSYGMGFFVPAFMTSLKKMGLAVEMSRNGLEVAQQTAKTLTDVQDKIEPLIQDVKQVVGDIRPVVSEVSAMVKESKGLIDDLVHEIREGNGNLHGKIGDTLKKAVEEARKGIKGAEGDFENLIWKKVDAFLAGVFDGKQEVPEEEKVEAEEETV